jgi:hypothetical protein
MFIPTWLLVLIVVVVVSMFAPAIWRDLWDMATELFLVLVVVSVPVSLYFAYKKDEQSAILASLPWIAAMALGVLFSGVESIRTNIWLHEIRVRAAGSPQAVEKLRREFAENFGLGPKMWQFCNDVKHFPGSYARTDADGKAFKSAVIKKDEITTISGPDQARALGLDYEVLNEGESRDEAVVVYSFSAGTSQYAFCTRPKGSEHNDDGELLFGVGVWVIQKPARVVLAMRLQYSFDDYSESFSGGYVEAFRPGPWLPALLSVVDLVHKDEAQRLARWWQQRDEESAKRNFV